MNNTMQYAALTATNSTLQHANMGFAVTGLALTAGMALLLNVSLVDVALGVVLGTALGFVVGAVLPILAALIGRIDWYLFNLSKVAQVLGPMITISSVAYFVGLSAAILIVIAPMMMVLPAFALFRAWAVKHYD